jgi:hypothetical protein
VIVLVTHRSRSRLREGAGRQSDRSALKSSDTQDPASRRVLFAGAPAHSAAYRTITTLSLLTAWADDPRLRALALGP